VIGAATIRACLEGVDVVSVRDGFEWLPEPSCASLATSCG
jgi:hypothetical protein